MTTFILLLNLSVLISGGMTNAGNTLLTECNAASLANIPEWELSITAVNAYSQEFGPDENHSTVTHELRKTGTFYVIKTEPSGSGIISWEGAGSASLSISRESLTVMINPQGARVESHHQTDDAATSGADVLFYISPADQTYSFTVHDAFIEALTVSTQKYLFPDGTLFREDVEEKTERFNLVSAVYDVPLSGECILEGSDEQGLPDNINHKKIEWSLRPVR